MGEGDTIAGIDVEHTHAVVAADLDRRSQAAAVNRQVLGDVERTAQGDCLPGQAVIKDEGIAGLCVGDGLAQRARSGIQRLRDGDRLRARSSAASATTSPTPTAAPGPNAIDEWGSNYPFLLLTFQLK